MNEEGSLLNPNLAISSLLAIVFSESTITKKGAWASFRGIHALKIALAFFDPLFTVINMKILITVLSVLLVGACQKSPFESCVETNQSSLYGERLISLRLSDRLQRVNVEAEEVYKKAWILGTPKPEAAVLKKEFIESEKREIEKEKERTNLQAKEAAKRICNAQGLYE